MIESYPQKVKSIRKKLLHKKTEIGQISQELWLAMNFMFRQEQKAPSSG
jgi:hypothetical protein